MGKLQFIVLLLIIIYSVLSPLFKNKNKGQGSRPPGYDPNDGSFPDVADDMEEKNAYAGFDELKEFRDMLGVQQQKSVQPAFSTQAARSKERDEAQTKESVSAPLYYKESVIDKAKIESHQEKVESVFQAMTDENAEAFRQQGLAIDTVYLNSRARALRETFLVKSNIREAYLIREILDKPLAMRRRNFKEREWKRSIN